jgi:hypothetical protein
MVPGNVPGPPTTDATNRGINCDWGQLVAPDECVSYSNGTHQGRTQRYTQARAKEASRAAQNRGRAPDAVRPRARSVPRAAPARRRRRGRGGPHFRPPRIPHPPATRVTPLRGRGGAGDRSPPSPRRRGRGDVGARPRGYRPADDRARPREHRPADDIAADESYAQRWGGGPHGIWRGWPSPSRSRSRCGPGPIPTGRNGQGVVAMTPWGRLSMIAWRSSSSTSFLWSATFLKTRNASSRS